MPPDRTRDVRQRLDDCAGAWGVVVERRIETGRAAVAFGHRDDQPVIVKVVSRGGDEWTSGDVLRAFGGHGVVRLLEHAYGAVLLERMTPGHSLVDVVLAGDDEQATIVLADVIRRMSPREPPPTAPTIEDWGRALTRYAATGDRRIPRALLESAQRVYAALCASQPAPRLLHGDLHHGNVLFDSTRGWLAIDPKGVVGEPAYELGAALRNPADRPDVFTDTAVIDRRVACFARELRLDPARIVAWASAQAVLAAVWAIEDGDTGAPIDAWLTLARTTTP